MLVLGLDVGGTKVEATLFEHSTSKSPDSYPCHLGGGKTYRVVASHRTPTERMNGQESILENIAKACAEALKKAQVTSKSLSAIGVGLPGPVHPQTRMMVTGNTSALVGADVLGHIKSALHWDGPTSAENDANCFALAEVLSGYGQTFEKNDLVPISQQVAVGIILGTGVGGGIIVEGKILGGKMGGAGEVGHTELITEGHPCYCGNKGCVEQYLSGPAIEAAFATRSYSQIENHPGAKSIFEMAENKEPIAMAVVKDYQKSLAKFLAQLNNLYNPHYFVLGGGMSLEKSLYQNLETKVQVMSFISDVKPTITQHTIGDSAGVLGAAILAVRATL